MKAQHPYRSARPTCLERPVMRRLRAAFAPLAGEVQVDHFGNRCAIKRVASPAHC